MTFSGILNSPLLYALVIAAILYLLVFSILTIRRSYKRGIEIGMDPVKLKNAAISSMIYSVVPSTSIVIGLFSLAAVLGVPWPWFRLSVAGSVMYELTAADMASTAMGYSSVGALGEAGDASVVGIVMYVMSICILGGIVGSMFFTKSIQKGMNKARGNGGFGVLATNVVTLAMMAAIVPIQICNGPVHAAVLLTAVVVSMIHGQIIKRFGCKWLGNFVMADSLIIGMASALLWTRIF